ncbi:MAG: hypothetical protein LAN84_05865 [Acidobacteriia bacterium]|nr:hypothetical protein [Terriglobia bacterium]
MKLPEKPLPQRQKLARAGEGPAKPALLLEERRRNQRVMLRMPVILHVPGKQNSINAMTVAVNELGAMLVVSEPLPLGTRLIVENPKSQKRLGASVTRAPQVSPEGSLVPVEFAARAPAFWNIFFPPSGS